MAGVISFASVNHICYSLVEHFKLVESFYSIVWIDNAKVEDIPKQCKSWKDFSKIEQSFISKEEYERADQDSSISINSSTDVFDVDIRSERAQLLSSHILDPFGKDVLLYSALDLSDALNHLRYVLNARVSLLLKNVLETRYLLVWEVL